MSFHTSTNKTDTMSAKIFINIPVKDLKRSMDFYTQMGFTNNPMFSDDTAASMVFSEEIYVMLLTHDKFRQFIKKEMADTSKTAAVINCLSVDDIDTVNRIADNAVKAGGSEPLEPKDYGFMQQRSIEDPDGNLWEVLYMDISKFPQQQQ